MDFLSDNSSKIKSEDEIWKTLYHNGILFTPEYKQNHVPLYYDGKPCKLNQLEEEYANYYAKYLDSDHIKKKIFNENFFEDFKAILSENNLHKIKDFTKLDFSEIKNYIDKEKEKRRNRSKEEKQKEKEEKLELQKYYGYAIVNGKNQRIGNCIMEPPGLFIGRGSHPKAGKIKRRIFPEDVTLNIGEGEKIPHCPIKGHNWGGIVHNHNVMWLASWNDPITGGLKYVWLSSDSTFKSQSDFKKFEKARKLGKCIKKIRDQYQNDMKCDDERLNQMGVAIYLIDKLAIRVGNEKDTNETSDTVGCCSLRVEHLKLLQNNMIELKFLGKDSMLYYNKIEVEKVVYQNLQNFIKNKKPKDEIFDQISVTQLNDYLKQFMKGLTAKVFRTFNASYHFQNELIKLEKDYDDDTDVGQKLLDYTIANKKVAVLCNHQRTVSKNFDNMIEKMDERIDETIHEIKDLKKELHELEPKKRKRQEDEKSDKKIERLKKKIKRLENKVHTIKNKKKEKDSTKSVALSTSKLNYIDPRISVSWAERNGVTINKIFNKALKTKFDWAITDDSSEDFHF